MKNNIINFLKANKHRDVNRTELLEQAKAANVYRGAVYDALKELEDVCNIGQWWDAKDKTVWLRWYPPNELTEWNQRLVDSGDDW